MLKAVDAGHKKKYGDGNVKVLKQDWNSLTMWNAHLVLHEHKEMLEKDKRNAERITEKKHRDEWTKRIVGEMIRKQSVNQFRVGEESTNFPKIKEQEYKRGITVEKITEILVNHREILIEWKKNKAKKAAEVRLAKERMTEERPVEQLSAEERSEALVGIALPARSEVLVGIALAEVDDWEDLDF